MRPPDNDLTRLEQDPPLINLNAVLAGVHADAGSSDMAERPAIQRLALAGAAAIAFIIVVLLTTHRVDLSVYPTVRLLIEALALAGAGSALLLAVLRPIWKPALSDRAIYSLAGVALAAPLVLALLPVAHVAHPASLEGAGADLAVRALKCLIFGLSAAAPIALVLHWLDRGDQGAQGHGLLLAGSAALVGSLALFLHCPITHTIHLLAGHATVPLALLLGLMLWRRRAM
ncbi:MAG: hypothetical protein ACI9WU_000606 [Myxococcota bacterium]|jgi:hypothetical protein